MSLQGEIKRVFIQREGSEHMTYLVKDDLPKKVTLEYLESQIVEKTFEMEPNGKTMICRLKMKNGTVFYGFSHCVDPSEFKKDLGEQYSYKQALDQAWDREGYLLAWLHSKSTERLSLETDPKLP